MCTRLVKTCNAMIIACSTHSNFSFVLVLQCFGSAFTFLQGREVGRDYKCTLCIQRAESSVSQNIGVHTYEAYIFCFPPCIHSWLLSPTSSTSWIPGKHHQLTGGDSGDLPVQHGICSITADDVSVYSY